MSTYEYRCKKCGHVFEVAMTLTEHEEHPQTPCPKCQSQEVEQLVAQVQVVTSKKT